MKIVPRSVRIDVGALVRSCGQTNSEWKTAEGGSGKSAGIGGKAGGGPRRRSVPDWPPGACTGEGGDGGSDQTGNDNAAGGGPQRSRWPGSGDGGADSGDAGLRNDNRLSGW